MKKNALSALVAACCVMGFAGHAAALTKDEYKAEEHRIDADYKAAKKSCDGMKANAKDICVSEAKGNQKVAKAENDAKYKPSPKAEAKVADVKADAAYDTAKEKCDDLAGNAKDACVKDAKAQLANAKAGYKTSMKSGG